MDWCIARNGLPYDPWWAVTPWAVQSWHSDPPELNRDIIIYCYQKQERCKNPTWVPKDSFRARSHIPRGAKPVFCLCHEECADCTNQFEAYACFCLEAYRALLLLPFLEALAEYIRFFPFFCWHFRANSPSAARNQATTNYNLHLQLEGFDFQFLTHTNLDSDNWCVWLSYCSSAKSFHSP